MLVQINVVKSISTTVIGADISEMNVELSENFGVTIAVVISLETKACEPTWVQNMALFFETRKYQLVLHRKFKKKVFYLNK